MSRKVINFAENSIFCQNYFFHTTPIGIYFMTSAKNLAYFCFFARKSLKFNVVRNLIIIIPTFFMKNRLHKRTLKI